MKRAFRSLSVCVMRSRTASASAFLLLFVGQQPFSCLKQLNSFQPKVWNEQPFFISFVESLVWRSCVTKLGSLSSSDGDWRRRLQKRHLKGKYSLHQTFSPHYLAGANEPRPQITPYPRSSVAHSYHAKKAKTHNVNNVRDVFYYYLLRVNFCKQLSYWIFYRSRTNL